MSKENPHGAPMAPPPLPGFGDSAQMSPDHLARERQAELQAAADQYEHQQKLMTVARRKWQNQRERAHLNLMAQLPKMLGAVTVGALLAYVVPMGGDR